MCAVDVGEHSTHPLVGGRGGVREIVGEIDVVAVDPGDASGEPHARVLQRGEVDGPAVRAADELERGFVAGADRIGHLVDRLVEGADPIEPPEDVHPAVAAGQAAVGADGEHDVVTGACAARRRAGHRWPRRRRRARHRRRRPQGCGSCSARPGGSQA